MVEFLGIDGVHRHLRKAEDRAFDDEWEVEVENLTIYEIVGSGAFGAVHRGALKGRIPLLEMNPSIKLYLEGMNEETLIVSQNLDNLENQCKI